MLAPDGTVMHCVPGFWHPADLAWHLRFAQRLHAVWTNDELTVEQKREIAARMQRQAPKEQPRLMTMRSGWQGFDAKKEVNRKKAGEERDTFYVNDKGEEKVMPINHLVHKRMAQRNFVAFADFDTPQFCDYGRLYYDNNKKVDGEGETFMTPRKVDKERQREARRDAQRERQQAQRERQQARRAQNQRQMNRRQTDQRERMLLLRALENLGSNR